MKKKKLKISKKTLSNVTNLKEVKGGARYTDYCLTSNCVSDFGTDCQFKTHGCCDGV